MLGVERQREVLRHMRASGTSNVHELADLIGVSPSTIRRDLRDMDARGLLVRVRGGASLADADAGVEDAHASRQAEAVEEKRRIGEAAAAMVADDSTILITGGTTTEAMLPFLTEHKGLTVVTNALNVAVQLSRHAEITVVVLGGIARPGEMSLLGLLGEDPLGGYRIDTAFTGAYGIDPQAGLTGASVLEARTDRILLGGVPQIVALLDGRKFRARGPVSVAAIDRLSRVITDGSAPEEEIAALRAAAVDVLVV